jgi:hypothetical protein
LGDEPREYWFNTKTGEVEVGKQVAAIYRIGPFDSQADAARALEILAERSRAWASEDDKNDSNGD